MKIISLFMMLALSVPVFAQCNQSLNQQLDNAPVIQMNDGSQFVSYHCGGGCPVGELLNFCAGVAHNAIDASVKAVSLTIDGTGRIIRNTLGVANGVAQTAACFVTDALGRVRAVACNLIGGGLGLAHNTVGLARRITRRTVGVTLRGLRRLRQVIFGAPAFNMYSRGNICGCSVGMKPAGF